MPRQRERQNSKRDSSRTLDHFFCKRPTQASPFLGRRDSSQSSRNPGLKPRPTNRSSTCNPEIIIIDSDDELEVSDTCIGVKKRRLSEDSDVEIVDGVLFPRRHDGLMSESQALDSSLPASSNTNSTCTFGKPYLLSAEATVKPYPGPSFVFGTPNSLLNPLRPEDNSDFRIATNSSATALMKKGTLREFHPNLHVLGKEDNTQTDQNPPRDPMEDWLMGDDENRSEGVKGDFSDDDDDDIEFVEEREVFLNTICPYCEKEFDSQQSLEVQAHINSCPEPSKARSEDRSTGDLKAPSADKFGAKNFTSNDAFSVLMSSFKENEAWKEATTIEDKKLFKHVRSNRGRRKAPFYKVLQGMPISVDAFRYGIIPGVTAYFLSFVSSFALLSLRKHLTETRHAHSDHYTSLSSSWKSGLIYCSQITANLIIHMLSVDRKWVRPLPMDTPTIIPDTNDVQVTLIEANHCPGSCLFLFEGRQTVNAGDSTFRSPYVGSSRIFRYLHCGDFRASPRHVTHPVIKGKKIDHVYLDTTYLDPKYTFPAQPLVISACAELSRRLLNGEPTTSNNVMRSWLPSLSSLTSSSLSTSKGKTLVVIGTYSIGKERIVKAVARALGSQVYCDSRKAAILHCEDDEELEAMLTSDPLAAIVHLAPLGTIATDRLKIYMDRFKGTFTKAVGFRPTGWTYAQPAGTDLTPSVAAVLTRTVQKDFTYTDLHQSPKSSSTVQVYGIPYSEHSSFYELTCFAMSLNWIKMIATVNVGSEYSRGKMSKWVNQWEKEKKRRSVDSVVTPRHKDYW